MSPPLLITWMSSKNAQIFVAKLPRNVSESEIREVFSVYGEISSISLNKGYCFVVGKKITRITRTTALSRRPLMVPTERRSEIAKS
jgi:hypothetical protein